MKTIQLTQGMVAMVDDEDHERLSKHNWHTVKNGRTYYAGREVKVGGKRKHIWMHREVITTTNGKIVDHSDGNGLNNQKQNLRECTIAQNSRNARTRSNKSGYKGVYLNTKVMRWHVQITVEKKRVCVGMFGTKEEAARAYNEAARKYHGEFARLNVLA